MCSQDALVSRRVHSASGPLLSLRGGDAAASRRAPRPEIPLQLTAFIFVLGISLVTLTPAPFVVEQLGTERGMTVLTALSTASAAAEICLAPLIGGLTDNLGRKPVLVATLLVSLLANTATAIAPTVALVAVSKFMGSIVVGLFFLSASASLADHYRTKPKQLAASSGVLFALVNAGFGVGIALSGMLPSSLRTRYATCSAVSLVGLLCAVLGVRESMPATAKVPFQLRNFDPVSFLRLMRLGGKMRLLVLLACLTFFPIFMGDTLQVYAINQWLLSTSQVAQLFTLISVSGVVANVMGGSLIKLLGLQAFTAIATLSAMLLWIGFSISHKAALVCAVIGVLGPARMLGTTTMMTSEGTRMGVPQGQLSGDRANLMAWLKMIGPVVYGQLYVGGLSVGVPQIPFILNAALTFLALLVGPIALRQKVYSDSVQA